MDTSTILLTATLFGNLAGLIWGASKLDSATQHLQKVFEKLEAIVGEHERRLSWMEGKFNV